MGGNKATLKSRYEARVADRQSFLDRARQCAELTLPTLIPPEGANGSTRYATPWQSLGARGVNALSSKLLVTLFPPNHPFFRLQLDDVAIMKIAGDLAAKAKIESGLSKYERAVQSEIETSGFRSPIFLMLKLLIVGGNAVLDIPATGAPRVFGLDSFVAVRDGSGNLIECIIREVLSLDTIDDEIRALIQDEHGHEDHKGELHPVGQDDDIELFTVFFRDGNSWKEYQEVCGKRVPGSEGTYPLDKPAKLVLGWTRDAGQNYSRSYVEEYLGDLQSLDSLQQAIVEASASMSKIVWLVNPNGTTRAKDLSQAESGDFVNGILNEVNCLQAEKQADLRIPFESVKALKDDLSFAFLLSSAVQRKGERVTAEEIRFLANELEGTLGGVFSTLAADFQLPLVRRTIHRMTKRKALPQLPDGIRAPVILTGLDALGRSAELQKLQTLMAAIQPFPEALTRIKLGNLLDRLSTAVMIDAEGLFTTDAEMEQQKAEAMQMQKQAAQQQQMGDLMGKAAPSAIKALSDQVTNAQQAGAPPEAPPV